MNGFMAVRSSIPGSFSPFSLPQSIWGIGIVTLLMNLSTVIIFSLSPMYLTAVLGVSTLSLGIFEGVVEAVAWFTRIFSGFISDYLRKRRPLLFIAYGLAALSRPIFALAPSFVWIFIARSVDRLGNGLQATPREALVGDTAPEGTKGACYGLRQTLGVTGSLIGALGVIYWIQENGVNYQTIFWMASIPPVLAVLTLGFFVKEPKPKMAKTSEGASTKEIAARRFSWRDLKTLKKEYWLVVGVASLFMLSNYSGAFMILQAKSVTNKITAAPLVMIFQNLASMLAAYPIGRLSDRFDRRKLLAIGFLTVIVSNLFLGFAPSQLFILIGASLWGMQLGITQSLLVAKVADTTTPWIRGTAFGIYYVSIALSLLLTNTITGHVFGLEAPLKALLESSSFPFFASWQDITGPQAAFLLSSLFAVIALLCLPVLKPVNPKKS